MLCYSLTPFADYFDYDPYDRGYSAATTPLTGQSGPRLRSKLRGGMSFAVFFVLDKKKSDYLNIFESL